MRKPGAVTSGAIACALLFGFLTWAGGQTPASEETLSALLEAVESLNAEIETLREQSRENAQALYELIIYTLLVGLFWFGLDRLFES